MSLHEAAREPLSAQLCVLGVAARSAARALREVTAEAKNAALMAAAAAIRAHSADILAANAEDMTLAKMEGLGAALLDRLALDQALDLLRFSHFLKRFVARDHGEEDRADRPSQASLEQALIVLKPDLGVDRW